MPTAFLYATGSYYPSKLEAILTQYIGFRPVGKFLISPTSPSFFAFFGKMALNFTSLFILYTHSLGISYFFSLNNYNLVYHL